MFTSIKAGEEWSTAAVSWRWWNCFTARQCLWPVSLQAAAPSLSGRPSGWPLAPGAPCGFHTAGPAGYIRACQKHPDTTVASRCNRNEHEHHYLELYNQLNVLLLYAYLHLFSGLWLGSGHCFILYAFRVFSSYLLLLDPFPFKLNQQ